MEPNSTIREINAIRNSADAACCINQQHYAETFPSRGSHAR